MCVCVFFPIILHVSTLAVAASPVAPCRTLLSYISDHQCCNLWSCTFRVPEFAPFWFTQPLSLPWPFAICCCNLSFPASPTQIMKDWSYHRETEGEENTESERENRRAGSTQGTELQYLWLCSAAVKCCCFNWSQTQLNAAVSSSQPDPKTTDANPPTHTHTHTHTGGLRHTVID